MTAHTEANLHYWAIELGWGFDCIHRYGFKETRLTKGQHAITVYLARDDRVRSAFRRRMPSERHDVQITGGRDAIIKIMKELS
jgi:hypothetical protein